MGDRRCTPAVEAVQPPRRDGPDCAGPPRVTVWVCDVNGVLIDSTAAVREAFVATAARYRFRFGERDFQSIKGLPLLEAYRLLDPGGDARLRKTFHLQHIRERVHQLHAFADVRDTLVAAREIGIRIGAATSHGEIAEAALVHTGLYALLACLVTQEEVQHPKPHPEAILRSLALLGEDPQNPNLDALHIGDTVEDIKAGQAAGVRTVGVAYGISRETEIRLAEPDDVIHSFREMQSWLAGADLDQVRVAATIA